MRPCPNCECFVSVTAKRCPRCEAALEPVGGPELALVGAPTDPIVRSVVASVALPKLPQPYETDPLEAAPFLGVPVQGPEPGAPAPEPTPAPSGTDEPAAELSAATLAAIQEAADEIKALAEPEPERDPEPEPEPEPEARAEPPDDPPPPTEPAIVATPLAAPVVITAPDNGTKPPRRKWFTRRDAFTRRFTRRERVLAKTCAWLVVALAVSILALRLPVGARPELGATTVDGGGQIGTPVSPITSPFADAIRIQTTADLRVVVGMAGRLHSLWKSYLPASPAVLGHELPQFAFVRGAQTSVRVGQLSVARSKTQIVFAEFAGPKGCAYARLVVNRNAQVVIGATGTACRATTPPARGWSALGEG